MSCTPRTSSPTNAASMPDDWTTPPICTRELMLIVFEKEFALTVQSGAAAAGGDAAGGDGDGGDGDGGDGDGGDGDGGDGDGGDGDGGEGQG